MARRSGRWLAAAAIFTIGNLAGGVFAAAQREWMHASVHVALMLIGAIATWLLAQRDEPHELSSTNADILAHERQVADRMTQLEQSIDAIGIEAGRIGEGQRRITQLFAEQGLERDDARPDESNVPRNAPDAKKRRRSP